MFAIAFLTFTAPVVSIAIIQIVDFASNGIFPGQVELAAPVLDSVFIAIFIGWLLFLVAAYAGLRSATARLKLALPPRTRDDHGNEIVRLVYCGVMLAIAGGVGGRIRHQPWFLAVIVLYIIAYTAVYECGRKFRIVLGSECSHSMSAFAISFFSCILGVFVGICLFITAFRVSLDFFTLYITCVIIIVALHAGLFGWGVRIHVHHWYWGLLAAHICVFRTDLSMVAQAMAIAIYIHGAACFGHEVLCYKPENTQA